MFDTSEVEEDGVVYVERSIPLAFGCYAFVGFLLLFAAVILVAVLVVAGVL